MRSAAHWLTLGSVLGPGKTGARSIACDGA